MDDHQASHLQERYRFSGKRGGCVASIKAFFDDELTCASVSAENEDMFVKNPLLLN